MSTWTTKESCVCPTIIDPQRRYRWRRRNNPQAPSVGLRLREGREELQRWRSIAVPFVVQFLYSSPSTDCPRSGVDAMN
jgi:hypothetical protein